MSSKPEGWPQESRRHYEAKVYGKASPSSKAKKPVYPHPISINERQLKELDESEIGQRIYNIQNDAKRRGQMTENEEYLLERYGDEKIRRVNEDKKAMTKETKDSFFYEFPKDRFYVIRWLADGGYHFFPVADGRRPDGYSSRGAAMEDWSRSIESGESRLVSGAEASRYPVPKRSG